MGKVSDGYEGVIQRARTPPSISRCRFGVRPRSSASARRPSIEISSSFGGAAVATGVGTEADGLGAVVQAAAAQRWPSSQEASGLWKTFGSPHTYSLAFTLKASPLSRSESGGPQSPGMV